MSLPHGNTKWTTEQLRDHLDRANNAAQVAWGAYISDLALAYDDAYKNVSRTLERISAFRKSKAEQAEIFWTLVLPAIAGGFLGGIVSLRMKAVLQESGIKFIEHSLVVDTLKTVTSDAAKYTTKQVEKSFQLIAEQNPWKPASADPSKFGEVMKNELLHSMLQINNNLIFTKKISSQLYRDMMFAYYNSPFIWNAPTEEDLKKWKKDLVKAFEVFLWADWSKHRDVEWWVERIGANMEDGSEYTSQLNDLDPILERLKDCGVPERYVTYLAPAYIKTVGDVRMAMDARVRLNILAVRNLARYYPDTFLSKLLGRLALKGGAQSTQSVDLEARPGSYRLM